MCFAFKFTESGRKRQRMVFRMVGGYGPRISSFLALSDFSSANAFNVVQSKNGKGLNEN